MHLYASSWEKAGGPAWLAKHNIDHAVYQKDFDELPAQGYRAVSIAAVSSADGTRFASLWEKTGGPAWRGRHGLSSNDYLAAKAELEGQGFKPRCLSGYTENGQARFIALWEQVAADRTAVIDLTSTQYQTEFDAQMARGAHPIWVTVYATSAGARYGAIFEKGASRGFLARHNIGVAEFTTVAEDQAKNGMRLVCAQGCAVGGGDVYTGVWEPAPGQTWQQRHGLSADDHQTVFNLLTRAGYRLRFIGAGAAHKQIKLSRHAVVAYQSDFGGTATAMKMELNARGYSVTLTDVAADAITAINNNADMRRPGDRMFVYLGVHGGTPRWTFDDDDPAKCGDHALQTNNGTFYLRDVLPAFERTAARGVDLTVVDGSCNGGETVWAAMGHNYAAVSTVGVMAPGLTGIPNPAAEFSPADPDSFGLWWNPSRTMASRLNGQFKRDRPDRVAQRVFRNDDCEACRLALFWRAAYSVFGVGNFWEMSIYRCHIYRYVFKESFDSFAQAEKDKFTLSVDAFITALRTTALAPAQGRIGQLKSYLANTALNNAAAAIYAPQDKQAWRLLNFDPELWTPESDPFANFSETLKRIEYWQKYWVYPNQYPGAPGFHRMVSDISTVISDLEALLEEMFDLFRRIARAAQFETLAGQITQTAPVLTLPDTLDEVRAYNAAHTHIYKSHVQLMHGIDIRRPPVTRITNREQFAKLERELVSVVAAERIADRIKPYRLDKSIENLVIDLHKVYERQICLLIKGNMLLSVVEDAWFAAQRNGRTYACDAGQF